LTSRPARTTSAAATVEGQ